MFSPIFNPRGTVHKSSEHAYVKGAREWGHTCTKGAEIRPAHSVFAAKQYFILSNF